MCHDIGERHVFMSASSSDIIAAINAGFGIVLNPFHPVLDGPGGIVSD